MSTPITDAAKWINAYPEYHEGATRYVNRELARRLETDRAALMEALRDIEQVADRYSPSALSLGVLSKKASAALTAAKANFPQP